MRHERPGHTLDATALVNEAYLRLIDQSRTDWKSRSHFFGIAAQFKRVRRVKDMAKGFYGRVAAYEAGLEQGHHTMAAALRRNLYGTVEPRELEVRAMAHYVIREAAGLATQDHGSLMAGRLMFGAPPDGGAAGGRAAMPE